MHARQFAVIITGGFLTIACIVGCPVQAQDARPAIQADTAKPIGKVVSVTGAASIQHTGATIVQAALPNQGERTKVGDRIYLGDVAQTGADGLLGITFVDGTAFNLSSNARMVMTEYLYDPKSKSNSTLLSLAQGKMTFIAGEIAKTGDMKIDTPVATMGIRGTTPRVEIGDDGSVRFSTLIEEGKREVLQKYGAMTVTPSPSKDGAGADATKPRKKLNLEICRGC